MKLLIICRSFPPVNIMGAVRPYEVSKYFREKGWDVTVICSYADSSIKDGYNVDLNDTKIIKAPKNKMINALNIERPNIILNLMKKIFKKIIFPEHFIFMVSDYEAEILKYIEKEGLPDYIFSTAKPISSHIVATKIKRKYPKIKWIADFRDLWAIKQNESLNFLKIFKIALEKRILNNADLVTVVTKEMKIKMSNYLPNNIEVIRNGADRLGTNVKVNLQDKKKYVISFTGILYNGFIDVEPIFEAVMGLSVEINFYGTEKNIIENFQKKYPYHKINIYARVAKTEIKKIQENSDFLLVGLGKGKAQKGVLPGKLFEYAETCKPIIAICDADSEMSELVNKYNLGIATRNPEILRAFFKDYCLGGLSIYNTTPLELTREYQLKRLEVLMENL